MAHPASDAPTDPMAVTAENPRIDPSLFDRPRSSEARAFEDPNTTAAEAVSIKLLREILDFQRRLEALVAAADPNRAYLIAAYRKSIRVRRQLLRELPIGDGNALPA